MENLFGSIEVRGARENNLKDVSLDIPKRKITVFTGVSGSGKSSLVFGTVAAESARLLNETHTAFIQSLLPSTSQPDVDALRNLSAAIVVDQQRLGGNSRSTVGTATDTYTMLRVIFSRLGSPAAGSASAFSFNSPEGMCPECGGLGKVSTLDLDEMVDWDKSLDEGAITLPGFEVDSWFWSIFAKSGFFDVSTPIKDFTPEQRETFLHGAEVKVKNGAFSSTYEGLVPKIRRLYLSKDVESMTASARRTHERVIHQSTCPACEGTRLSQAVLACRVEGKNIADCAAMQVTDLLPFVRSLTAPLVQPVIDALADRLADLEYVGLGYLSLSRETTSLSGGESQRVKMVRHLGSSLTDITYVFDEPSVGLHPHDLGPLNEMLARLRDKGNTVLVVEHKPEVMAIADHVVDMGPGAGNRGGEVIFEGTYADLHDADTPTGRHLSLTQGVKSSPRVATGALPIRDARQNNLKDVSVDIPRGVLTVVTGVAGSGKSSLIHGSLPQAHPEAIFIDQSATRGSRRSNAATYTGLLDHIRKLFAKANGVSPSLFSANSKGACPDCSGLGLIYTDLAFMDTMVTVCETCQGRRFTEEVLGHTLRGASIADVLEMSVVEAAGFFTEKPVLTVLSSMDDVGLGYLTLGQPLSTLSGGERQRLKLALELGSTSQVYVLDEPTTGLHMSDVDTLVRLLDRLVDNGSTVVVIEHNLSVISQADWVVDMGPGPGRDGGQVVFEGTPEQLLAHPTSATAEHLRRRQPTA